MLAPRPSGLSLLKIRIRKENIEEVALLFFGEGGELLGQIGGRKGGGSGACGVFGLGVSGSGTSRGILGFLWAVSGQMALLAASEASSFAHEFLSVIIGE